MKWKNLRPDIIRQRIVIEGTTKELVKPDQIREYLLKLAGVTKMTVLKGPFTGNAHELGYSGWVHWTTSGAHFYSYSGKDDAPALFTVDCYTCKPFDPMVAGDFTKEFFNAIELVWKEVEV